MLAMHWQRQQLLHVAHTNELSQHVAAVDDELRTLGCFAIYVKYKILEIANGLLSY